MGQVAFETPVDDSVAKVNDEVAVGEDLEFQRKWWRFERIIWSVFALLLVMALLGAFGRGYLARAERQSADGAVTVKYERIERTGTPSMLLIRFGPEAIHDGKVQLFVTESLVKELGAQRIIPAPATTEIGNGGLTYTFPATAAPASVAFDLQPLGPGIFHFLLQTPGSNPVTATVVVAP